MLQTIFAAQIQEAIDVPFPGPLLGCWTRESLRTTSRAKDGSPSLSGLTAFFDLAWMMVRLHAGPDDAPRIEIISKDQQDGGLPT
jgi:hypothetical protein